MRLRRLAAERPVDDGAGLSAGDLAFGLKRAVGVALDQPGVLRRGHIRREPVGRLHIGEIIIGRRTVVLREAHGDLRKLRAGDRRVRAERAVGIAADHAHVRKRGDRVVVPLVGRNIGEIILRRPVFCSGVVVQQPEEDRRDLRPRDLPVRANGAVGIADQIGIVVVGVGLQGREQDGGDVINVVALGLFYGLLVSAVFADARDHPLVRAVRLLDPTGFRDGKSVVLVAIGVLVCSALSYAVVIGTAGDIHIVLDHLAICPDGFAFNVDCGKAFLASAQRVFFFVAIIAVCDALDLEQTRASLFVHRNAVNNSISREIYNIIKTIAVTILFDIQDLLGFLVGVFGVKSAVFKVQNNRIFCAAVLLVLCCSCITVIAFTINIDRFSVRINVEYAAVKRHAFAGVVPQRITIG